MLKRVLTLCVAVLCIAAIASGTESASNEGQFIPQFDRSHLTTGVPPIPSNPPTPAAPRERGQFLWEDFETTTFPPTGWDTLNLNTGFGWYLGTYSGGGTQAAFVIWDSISPATLQDEWLITPELDVSGATSNLRVEFYMLQGYTYPHDFKVYVTDDDGTIWTEVFDSYGTGYPEFQWYFVSVPLVAWSGNADPVRIGFQYYGTDADLFGLDNVEVTDANPATGRCCVYDDPLDPECFDGLTQTECSALDGTWTEGLDCATSPCPLPGLQLEPSDDMYTDPDEGSGHSHPIDPYGLWVANYDGAGHHERAIIKWDLSSYEGQSADSAFLNIYRYFRCPNDYYTNCDLYCITEDWDEGTWNEYVHVNHTASPFMSYNFGPALDWYRIDISGVIQQWLDGSLENYGIVIVAQSGEKWSKFYSKEGTYPPYLEVYGLSATNHCPVLDPIGAQEVRAGDNLELTISGSDPDLTTPNLYCGDLPAGATFTDHTDGTGTFAWRPSNEQTGDYVVLFYADDGQMADSEYVSIHVSGCCQGTSVGNLDCVPGVPDMGDLTILIDHLFISLDPLCCVAEGDVDLSGQPDPESDPACVDMGDLTVLIDHLFISLNPLPSCP